jgi:hypothetical protein
MSVVILVPGHVSRLHAASGPALSYPYDELKTFQVPVARQRLIAMRTSPILWSFPAFGRSSEYSAPLKSRSGGEPYQVQHWPTWKTRTWKLVAELKVD